MNDSEGLIRPGPGIWGLLTVGWMGKSGVALVSPLMVGAGLLVLLALNHTLAHDLLAFKLLNFNLNLKLKST